MSDKKTNAAAEAVAALKLNLDTATEALSLITDQSTEEEKKIAQDAFDAAKTAYEKAIAKAPTKAKEKLVKGVFILSPTARFKLGYSAGEEASLPELQAQELDDAGFFKISK